MSSDHSVRRKNVADHLSELLTPARKYEQLQRMAALVEFADDAIISETMEGIITSWNRGAERIFGYTAQEVIGIPVAQRPWPDGETETNAVLDRIRTGEHAGHYETTRKCKDGSKIPISLTVSPIRNASGEIVEISMIARNISTQKQDEQALRVAEKLAAVSRLASSIAHHINNPLTAIINLLFLLKHENLSTEGEQYLATAQRELSRVAHISSQALGFYRSGQQPVWISVSTILEDALLLHQGRINVSRTEVSREYRPAPPICCQPGELRQVVVNLVGNALDAMPLGGRLRLRIRRATNWITYRQGVRIIVADSGVGMDPETRRRLFEPFYSTKDRTGTGLGLWICADIVGKYDGRISMRSTNEPSRHGSVFILFLPL